MRELIKNLRFPHVMWLAFVVLLLFQILAIALIINETHWLGPVQDFWGSIPFIEKTLASGNWFGHDLWLAQNNHRLVLPRLAFLIDYHYFDGSNIFLSGLGIALIGLQMLLLFILIKPHRQKNIGQWLIVLAGSCVLTMPLIVYNLLHTFNSQWLQCAFLALLACLLFAKGLEKNNRPLLLCGIFSALACNFTTFTLTAIWPALFLLLLFYRKSKSSFLILGIPVILFSWIFISLLPTANDIGASYDAGALLATLKQAPIILLFSGLLVYLIQYLTIPDFIFGNAASTALTCVSLIVWILALARTLKKESTQVEKICLSVLFFCICLGLTTALGRAFLGSVALSPRFGPIVLLYWACFWIYALSYYSSSTQAFENKNRFYATTLMCFVWILLSSVSNALNMGKRLAEDYNRFAYPQMAYLTDNLAENALYENMVPEWRSISYPGILQAIPYLKNGQKGIFNSDFAKIIHEPLALLVENPATCLHVQLTQKPRSQDDFIRNLSIESDTGDSTDYPFLVFYKNTELIGAAFNKRLSSFKTLLQENAHHNWSGISKIPLDNSVNNRADNQEIQGFAYSKQGIFCRIEIINK